MYMKSFQPTTTTSFLMLWVTLVATRRTATAWVPTAIARGTTCTRRHGVGSNHVVRASSSSSTTTEEDASTTSSSSSTTTGERLTRANLSLDLRTITNHLDTVTSHLQSRNAASETVQAAQSIAEKASRRVSLIQERDNALNQRKECSAIVGKFMRNKDNLTDAEQTELEQAKQGSTDAAALADKAEQELELLQTQMDDMLDGIPNLLDDRVPEGKDENDNEEVYVWGETTALAQELDWPDDFEPAWHDDVATGLQGYQAERAVAMSGARFIALSGVVAQLERALSMFFVDLHSSQHGYTEVSVPYVVGRSALEGTGQLPKFEEDLFAITPQSHTCNGEDAFLIPTAEVPVTNLHRDQVLEESDLPLSYVALTPCFRAEAGSYGRDTKGLIRTHQFQKVELVKITTADSSDDQHEELTKHAEACLQQLKLPYRKVRLCAGDIGFGARHCYDLEVWLPGAKEFREISSCSNTGDFQARRMALRYRPSVVPDSSGGKKKKKKPKPVLCHTINGSGLAVGRALVAVLENYQMPDGSVVVPEVLRPYMGGKEKLEAPSNA